MSSVIEWEKLWQSKTSKTSQISSPEYWSRRAEDYNDYIRTSNFDHGYKIKELLMSEGVLAADMDVLDIAAGPGSITIPFAGVARKVTAVEPAVEMCRHLRINADEKGLKNVEVINRRWQDVDDAQVQGEFDLCICSQALWQFPDIVRQIQRINGASRGYCCIAIGAGPDSESNRLSQMLGIDSWNQDRFLCFFNILCQQEILANVRMIDTMMKRSVKSAISMWELNLGKYQEPTAEQKAMIREHVLSNSKNGFYEKVNKLAVVWWPAKKGA